MNLPMSEGQVAGGWDALDNVIDVVGGGVSTLTGSFFPAPQKLETTHLPVEQMGGAGQTYRPTAPDAPSIIETMAMRAQGWLDTPFEPELAPTRRGTTTLDQAVKATQPVAEQPTTVVDIFRDVFGAAEGVLAVGKKVRTMADDFIDLWGLRRRDTIEGTPRAGYPEGRNETHLSDLRSQGALIVQAAKGYGENIIRQVKGLFSLGYDQAGSQGAFAIKHELQPSRQTWVGMGIAVAVILVIILLGRKR